MPARTKRNPLEDRLELIENELPELRQHGKLAHELKGRLDGKGETDTVDRADRQTNWIAIGIILAFVTSIATLVLTVYWHYS